MLSISALLQWCALALPLVQGLTVGVQPPSPTAARLTVVQVTDVYTLENFPRLKTLLHDVRETNPTTISMLTGDFLAPYLLSSIDKGHGMSRRPRRRCRTGAASRRRRRSESAKTRPLRAQA